MKIRVIIISAFVISAILKSLSVAGAIPVGTTMSESDMEIKAKTTSLEHADILAHETTETAVADSIETQLDEVVVEGRTQRVIKNGVEYIPGKNMKKMALDAYSLLYNMQIPKLMVSPIDNSVTSPAGDDVAIYIDYRPADQSELSGMRPEDVLRVEVLDYPQDPRFQGSARVVNFVMKQYKWGGYTKLYAVGSSLNGNHVKGEAYSRFITGKWRIDAVAEANGVWNDKIRQQSASTFRDFLFEGEHIDEIRRSSNTSDSYQRSNGEQAHLRFAYQTDKSYIAHTLGFNRAATPFQNADMSVDFTRSLLPSSEAVSNDSEQSIGAQIFAYYWFGLPKNNSLSVLWEFGHSGNRLNSFYELHGEQPIINGNKERVYRPTVNIFYSKGFKHNNMLNVLLASYNTFFDTDYTGSFKGKQKAVSSETQIFLEYTQSFGFGLNIFARVGESYTLARLNGENLIHKWNPRLGLQIQYQPNQKHMFNIDGWLYNSYPEPSRANEAVVRSNELLWSLGNPDLKTVLGRMTNASYTFIPRNNFSLTASVKYEIGINRTYYDYVTVPGLDGIVRTYGLDNREKQLKALLSASLRLFNNSLGISLQGGVKRQVNSGEHPMNKTSFLGMAQVSCFIRNFSASAYYAPPAHDIYDQSGNYLRRPDTYGLNLTYALKNFRFRFDVMNIFNSGRVHETYRSFHYDSDGWRWSSSMAKSLRLTVTYTLPYGMKVLSNGELQNDFRNSSAILEH